MMSFGLGGILLILFMGWITLALGGLLLRCFGRAIPLLLLVGAGFIGGLTMAGHDMHAADSKVWVDHDLVPDGRPERPSSVLPEPLTRASEGIEQMSTRWKQVALAAMLIIGGSLLLNRRRPDSVPHKLLTVVGLAAVGFLVATFMRMPSDSSGPDRDRVVRVVSRDTERKVEAPPSDVGKRPARAKPLQ